MNGTAMKKITSPTRKNEPFRQVKMNGTAGSYRTGTLESLEAK
jgi:hypothetical protein